MVKVNKSEMDVNVGRKERKKGIGGHKRCCYGLCKSDSKKWQLKVQKWWKLIMNFLTFILLLFRNRVCGDQFRRNEIKQKRLQDHIRKCKRIRKKW